jgi:hypothetical protein
MTSRNALLIDSRNGNGMSAERDDCWRAEEKCLHEFSWVVISVTYKRIRREDFGAGERLQTTRQVVSYAPGVECGET